MRPSHLLLILLSPLLALAWSADDHEIFRLNDELRALEGTNATFYSFLTVSSTATSDEINKSYRTRSRTLHPDKAIRAAVSKLEKERAKQAGKLGKPSKASVTSKERQRIAKEANERYKRLPNIVAILRDHRRERYDYFLKNGFPAWRGSGYYYARFRPGIGSVIAGLLLVFGGGMHYGAMYIGWKRRREFVERYVGHARRTAWGDDTGIPGLSDALNGTAGHNVEAPPPDTEQDGNIALNRKQKRMQEKESKREKNKPSRMARLSKSQEVEGASQTSSARKKVMAENGKVLIVDAEGNVFLQEETEEGDVHELLLDVSSPRLR